MAGATRLELATSGVTGRRSNQLNYAPALGKSSNSERAWWAMTGLNRRPPACKAGALPTELIAPKTSGIITEGNGKSTAFLCFQCKLTETNSGCFCRGAGVLLLSRF